MPKMEPRDDYGFNVEDSRGKSWAVYPPGVVPTRKTTVYNGVLPMGTKDEELWPKSSLWVACLRLPAYTQAPWKPLATGSSEAKILAQVEMFGEDTDLVISGKSDGGALLLAALLAFFLLSDGK